jgi:hypothetical protein
MEHSIDLYILDFHNHMMGLQVVSQVVSQVVLQVVSQVELQVV